MTLLILAMVLSAAGMKAYEQGKTRSKARWEEARRRAEQRGAARERARQQAAQRWERRWNSAIAAGPRRALWWAYAGGYLAGSAVMALGAGAVGVYSGAVAGGRSGYRIGIEAGKAGRRYRETFRAWRRANRDRGDPIELGICGRCGGWIRASDLIPDTTHGRVCPDCVPSTKPGHTPGSPAADEPIDVVHERKADDSQSPRCECGGWLKGTDKYCWSCLMRQADYWDRVAQRAQDRRRQEEEEHRKHCPGNPNIGPGEAKVRGLCPDCGGRGELITDFGGEHKHVTCPECEGSGKYRPTGTHGAHYRTTANDASHTADEQKQGPIRVTAERIYPETDDEPQPKEIANTMTALEPAPITTVDTSGEGYASTVAGLESLATLLREVHTKVNDLNESLTSNSLDADTLNQMSDMTDDIEAVAEKAADLHTHVVDRHEALAGATAEAGGSQNVATKTFYDNY